MPIIRATFIQNNVFLVTECRGKIDIKFFELIQSPLFNICYFSIFTCLCNGCQYTRSDWSNSYIAFSAGNLIRVAQKVREKNPKAKIIIAADDDALTEGNPA